MSCTCLGNVYTDNNGNIQYLTEYMCLEIIANNPNCCDFFNETCLNQIYFNSKSENYVGCNRCPSENSVCCENIQTVANNLNPNKDSKCCSFFDEYCVESYEILKNQKGTECYNSTAIKEFYKENYSNNEYTCNYSDKKLDLCIDELSCNDVNNPKCLEQLSKKIFNTGSNCKCSCAYKFPREGCMAEIIHAKSECCHTWTAECDEIFENLSKDILSDCSVVSSQNQTQQLVTEIDCGCVYTEPTINNVSCCFKDLCTVFNNFYGSSFDCNTVSPSLLIHFLIANTNLYDTCQVDPIVDSSCPNQDCPSSPFFDPISGPPCAVSLFFDLTVFPLCTAPNCYHGPDCRIWPYGAIEGCNRKTALLPTVNANGLCQRVTTDSVDYYDCAAGIADQINLLLQGFGGYTNDCITTEYIIELAKRYINIGNPIKATTTQECCKLCTQNGQPPSDIILPSCNNNYNSTWSSPPDLQQNPSIVYENRTINFNVEGSAGLFTTTFGLTKFNSSSNFNLIDVTDSSLTKSIDIADGSGTVSWTFKNRAGTQGDRPFKGILYGACNAEPIYVTPKIILTDTPPSATFTITATNTNIYESQSPNQTTVNISGSNVFTSTNLYWKISGTVNINDFIGLSSLEGQVTLTQASSTSSFTLRANPDQTTESSETFVVILYSDAARTQEISRTPLITINDDSTTPIPVYELVATPSVVIEGNSVRFDLSVTNLPSGTTNRYYTISNDSGSGIQTDDFNGGLNGTIILSNGIGSSTKIAANNSNYEGDESYKVQVYADAARTILNTTLSGLTLRDADPIYNAISNTQNNQVVEGSSISFTLSGTNIPATVGSPKTFYYEITPVSGGTIEANDFIPSGLTGSFVATSNTTSFTITTANNPAFENQFFNVRVSTDISFQNIVAVTPQAIKIVDGTKKYILNTDPSGINTVGEGSDIIFKATTENVQSGTILTYKIITTNAEAEDFVPVGFNGSFSIDDFGIGYFGKGISADKLTDGQETFRVCITDSNNNCISNEVGPISIQDISREATYEIAVSTEEIAEGESVSIDIYTQYNSTFPLYYKLVGVAANDFTPAGLTGEISFINLGGYSYGSFSKTALADASTEGDERFVVEIYPNNSFIPAELLQSYNGITILDTSRTVSYGITGTPSVVNEGDSVTFEVTSENSSYTQLFYKIEGTNVTKDDFVPAGLTGVLNMVGGDQKSATLLKGISLDRVQENSELFNVKLYPTAAFTGSPLKNSNTIQINNVNIQYSINPSGYTIINEGTTRRFTIETNPDISINLVYGITKAGQYDILPSDLNMSSLTGQVQIVNGTGFIDITPADVTINKLFVIQFSENIPYQDIILSSGTIEINDITEQYTLIVRTENGTSQPFNIIEGGKGATFTLNVDNVSDGTAIKYIVNGAGVIASDFTDNLLQGIFYINNQTGSFHKAASTDAVTPETESFVVDLYKHYPPPLTTPDEYLTTSPIVNIIDATQTYSITTTTPNPTNTLLYEGQGITFTVNTTNVPNGTVKYYRFQPTTSGLNTNDFNPTGLLGSFVINNNVGTFHRVTSTSGENALYEGDEKFICRIGNSSGVPTTGGFLTSSSQITIRDAAPTAILNHPSSVREGESIQIIVDTTNLQVPINLTYEIDGPAGQLDSYSGQISINSSGQGLINLTALNDFETPENDSFIVKVYSSLVTEPIGTSTSISIIDVPIEPVFIVQVNENSIYFGDTLTFTVTAENIGRSYSMVYKIIDAPILGSLNGTEFNPEGLTGSFEIIYNGTPSAITTFDIQVKENVQTAFSFILAISQEETPDNYEDLTNPISASDVDAICAGNPKICPKANIIYIENVDSENNPIVCEFCEVFCYSGFDNPECENGSADGLSCCSPCKIIAEGPGCGVFAFAVICPDECIVDPPLPTLCTACDDNCGYVSYAGGKDYFIGYATTPWKLFVPSDILEDNENCGIAGSFECENVQTSVCKVQYKFASASYGRFSIKQFTTVKENGVWKNKKMTEEEMNEYINKEIIAQISQTQTHGEAWRSREPCSPNDVNYYGPSTLLGHFNQVDNLERESGIANCKGWFFNENADPGEPSWGINEYKLAYEVGPSQIRLHSMGLYNVEQETDPDETDVLFFVESNNPTDDPQGGRGYVILPPVERISQLDQFGNLSCTPGSTLNEEFLKCENYKYIYGAEIPEGNTLLRNLYDYPQRQVTFETDECCKFIQACFDTSIGECIEQDTDCIRRMTQSCEERAFKFCITGGCTLTSETSGNYDSFVYYFQGLSSYYTPDSQWPDGITQTKCFTYNSGGETIYDFTQFSSYSTTGINANTYVENSAPPQTTGICYKRIGYNDVTGNDQFTCSKIMSIAAGKQGTNDDRKAIFDYIKRTVDIYFNDTIVSGLDEYRFISQIYMTQCICNYLDFEDKTALIPPERFPYPEAPYYAKNANTRFSSCYALDAWKSQVRELPSGADLTITNLEAQCQDNPDIKWTVSFSDPLYPSKPAQFVRCPTGNELQQFVNLPKPKYYPSYWQDRSDIELTFTFNLNAIFRSQEQNTNVSPQHHCGANFRDIEGYEKYKYTPNFSVTAPCYPCKGFTNYPMDESDDPDYGVSDLVNKLDNNVLEFLSYTRSGIYSDGSAIPGANTATRTPREANPFVAQANVHQPLGQLVARMTLQEQVRQSKIFHENVCQFILMLLCSGVEVLHTAELTKQYHDQYWLNIPGVTYNKNRESIKDVYGGRLGETDDALSTFPLTPDTYERYYGEIRDGGSININGTNFNESDGNSEYFNVWERGIQPTNFDVPWTSADPRDTNVYPKEVLVGNKGKSSGLNPIFNSEIGIIRRHKGINLPDAGINLPLCRPPVDTWNDSGTNRTQRGKCNLPNNLVFGGFCWITNVIDRPLWNKMKEINQLYVDSSSLNPYEALKLNIPNLQGENISIPEGMNSSDFDGFDAWVNWPDRQGNGSNNLSGYGLNNIEVEVRLFELLDAAIRSFISPSIAPGDNDIVETYLNSIYGNIHIEEELYTRKDNRDNRNYTINDLKAGSESTGFRWLTLTVNGQEKQQPSYNGSQYDNASACYIEEVPPDINSPQYSGYLEVCEYLRGIGFDIECDSFTNFLNGVARNHNFIEATSTLCAEDDRLCTCTDPDEFEGCPCGFCQALSPTDSIIDLPITVEIDKQCTDPPVIVVQYDVTITVGCISSSIAVAINSIRPNTTNAITIASIINKLIAVGKTACVFKYNNKTYRQMRKGKDLI